MKQNQFDQLLAWTMLHALHSGVLALRAQVDRPLTDAEVLSCHQDTYTAAQAIQDAFAKNRQESATPC